MREKKAGFSFSVFLLQELAEDRISFGELEPWFNEHETMLFEDDIRGLSLYNDSVRSAIMHFREYDEDLVGELAPQVRKERTVFLSLSLNFFIWI